MSLGQLGFQREGKVRTSILWKEGIGYEKQYLANLQKLDYREYLTFLA